MIFPTTPRDSVQFLRENLRRNLENVRLQHRAFSEHVTISVSGALTTPRREDSSHLLIGAANEPLYEAKRVEKPRRDPWLERSRRFQCVSNAGFTDDITRACEKS